MKREKSVHYFKDVKACVCFIICLFKAFLNSQNMFFIKKLNKMKVKMPISFPSFQTELLSHLLSDYYVLFLSSLHMSPALSFYLHSNPIILPSFYC